MFFFSHVALGIVIGLVVGRAIHWRRFHHGFHGGCGRMGHGPWRFGGPLGRRFGVDGGHLGPRQLFWLIRELRLSPAQMSELKAAWLKGRGAVASVRASGFEAGHAFLEAALAEPFDRARLDDAARRHAEDHAQAARELADAVAHAVEVLTVEQRQILRDRFARFGADFGAGRGPMGPDQGPYRTGGVL
jgi:Spy/CpxP family protein refolding chaperone